MFDIELLIKCFQEPDLNKVEILADYLRQISGKDLSLPIIRQYLLKVKWKEKESKLLSRCHCKAASLFLEHLKNNGNNLNKDQVKTLVADIVPYVANLDPTQITSFIEVSTNILPSTIHYKHARSLFYRKDLPDAAKNNYGSDLLVLYALRLSLEKRIRGFLGIDFATMNGKPIGVARLLDICKDLKEVKYSTMINWQEIQWVNTWLNHHMHRHLRPYPWIIHQAFEILNTILKPSKYNHGDKEILSFYASTVVFNEDQFSKEILTKLEVGCSNLEIKWSWKKEILNVKQ